jgi:phage/plasmid-like protein (TIGR03299 family)
MGHEIEASDKYFSVRELPWHFDETGDRATIFQDYPGRDEAMTAAGHNFELEPRELWLAIPEGGQPGSKVEGWRAIVRKDTGDVFQAARDTYEIVQNSVPWDIVEAVLEAKDNGFHVEYETGGTQKSGAVCWVTAKANKGWLVTGDDSPIIPYVSVIWGHDGTAGIRALTSSVRIVCANTLAMAESDARNRGTGFTFRHTKNVHARIEEAKKVLRGMRGEFSAFVELAEELAGIKISKAGIDLFLATFIPSPPEALISDRVMGNIEEARDKVRGILASATIPEAHKGTGYGLLQAGVEYLDHLRGYRNQATYLNRTLLRAEPLKAKLVPLVREAAKV